MVRLTYNVGYGILLTRSYLELIHLPEKSEHVMREISRSITTCLYYFVTDYVVYWIESHTRCYKSSNRKLHCKHSSFETYFYKLYLLLWL